MPRELKLSVESPQPSSEISYVRYPHEGQLPSGRCLFSPASFAGAIYFVVTLTV